MNLTRSIGILGIAMLMAVAFLVAANTASAAGRSFSAAGPMATSVQPATTNGPVNIVFYVTGIPHPASKQKILTVDSVQYEVANFPLVLRLDINSSHTYAYANSITIGNQIYTFSTVHGCSLTKRVGYLFVRSGCGILATYVASNKTT